MSDTEDNINISERISALNLTSNDNNYSKFGKKVGPAVPPKPQKKSQPQIPQSYSIKTTSSPCYSTLLNNTDSKPTSNIYINSPIPYTPPTTNNESNDKLYENSQNFGCNYYSNIGNLPAPQVPMDDRTRNIVYSNVEPRSKIIYGNVERTYSNDDLPPPPPEPTQDYIACTNFPPPPSNEDLLLPPPPSPVSSSYSELRKATYQDIYGSGSGGSSTYESIYEPINPRPPSQLSSSNYSLYSGYGSNQHQGKISPVKEVDALTDLLVQDMSDDIYGICAQCGCKVEGEGAGCSAMDKVFHIECFSCYVCAVNLQGKPFYALDGKPYCEEDYLNTLEKCCVCTRAILDRILRATGRPYHPSCFTCVVCGQSLDGIPFTVDATNQIHCIQCFNKKFAPRCCVCKLPIMPEPGEDETVRVVALDRSFHIQCYKCEDCGLVLSSESEGRGCYPLDDHVLCKSCNATRVQALTSHMTNPTTATTTEL